VTAGTVCFNKKEFRLQPQSVPMRVVLFPS